MKLTAMLLLTVVLAGFLHAEAVTTNSESKECGLYVEAASEETMPHTVVTFLELNPLSGANESQWLYYIVHSDNAKQEIINEFLSQLRYYHKHSKLPFGAVADYWHEMFKVPIQMFVFEKNTEHTQDFSTSTACEKIIKTARLLNLNFMWNGALAVAEDGIKEILEIPAEYRLVTTIFLSPADEPEVSRAQN